MQTPLIQRFGNHHTVRVECVNGHSYEQDVTPHQLNPYMCGACGEKVKRLWELVYINANAIARANARVVDPYIFMD